jgi:hypothetical protein
MVLYLRLQVTPGPPFPCVHGTRWAGTVGCVVSVMARLVRRCSIRAISSGAGRQDAAGSGTGRTACAPVVRQPRRRQPRNRGGSGPAADHPDLRGNQPDQPDGHRPPDPEVARRAQTCRPSAGCPYPSEMRTGKPEPSATAKSSSTPYKPDAPTPTSPPCPAPSRFPRVAEERLGVPGRKVHDVVEDAEAGLLV